LYVDLLNCCGDGALTEFAEPTTTVTNGVVRGAVHHQVAEDQTARAGLEREYDRFRVQPTLVVEASLPEWSRSVALRASTGTRGLAR
jgi:hypothetical protein